MLPLHERYVNFYTDFAFKKLFGTEVNKGLLISFLNSLLYDKEVIADLKYINTENLGSQEFDRKAVFDVYCETVDGRKILVEMQKAEQQFFKDRSIFYSTFPIRDQAVKGNSWDYHLNAVYTIGILNFSFDEEDKEYYHHVVKLMDTTTHEVFYDKLTYIYLEMPKFNKTEEELDTMFDKWLYAIKNMSTLLERPAALRDQVFMQLFKAAEIARFNPQERMNYEESLKIYRDWFSVMKTAEIKGHHVGYEEGRLEGRKEGRKEGILEMAKNLKKMGMSVEQIMEATGLSREEILSF
ncbi:hypothetical protein EVA_18871 [gut metagenome]|uniref:Rpn family recombination-promoting nuclease/putative transposase n=1 Tax=gut metagenome TaxID=749906 RepID=J9FDT5_9ZZZZ